MERRVDLTNLDLDYAADLIPEREATWLADGITITPITWMDNDVDWPAPLLTDRRRAHRPMSLGLSLHTADAEAEFVLYAGGWVDLNYLPPGSGEVVTGYQELDDAEEFGPVLDRIASALAARPTA